LQKIFWCVRDSAGSAICGGPIVGFGNNAQPAKDGLCCDRCNERVVLPALLERILDAEHKRQGNGGDVC
jgi:hypothetical protein